jgi:glycosyltransferase involved in cell wall biosynthesis
MPLISVIIPCCGRKAELKAALGSLLEQTFPDWEAHVVFNDHALAGEAWLLRDRRICYHSSENAENNPAALRNLGLSCARGDYIAYLDDDDRYGRLHLEKSLEALENERNCSFLYTGGVFLDAEGRFLIATPAFYQLWDRHLQVVKPYCRTSSIVHRRRADIQWNEAERNIHEDWDLCYRVTQQGDRFTSLLPERTVIFSSGSQTRSKDIVRPSYLLDFCQFERKEEAYRAEKRLNDRASLLSCQSAGFSDSINYYKKLLQQASDSGRLKGPREELLQEIAQFYRQRLLMTLSNPSKKQFFKVNKGENCYQIGFLLPSITFSHLEDYAAMHRTLFPRMYELLASLLKTAGIEATPFKIERMESP